MYLQIENEQNVIFTKQTTIPKKDSSKFKKIKKTDQKQKIKTSTLNFSNDYHTITFV